MTGEWEIKQLIVDIGKRLWSKGFVAANDGNISVKISDFEFLTTPTAVSKGFMTPDMIVKVDSKGHLISRKTKYKPSSEILMHLEVYRERKDVNSVVHAHPPYCTSFAVAGIPLDKCVLPESIVVLGAVPIAEFGLPSTEEIPEAIRPLVKESDAILLANHGALTLGVDLQSAYFKIETLEHTAQIVWLSYQLGNVNVLPEDKAQMLSELRDKYNIVGKALDCDSTPFGKKQETKSSDRQESQTSQQDEGLSEESITKLKDEINKRLDNNNKLSS